MTHTIRLTEINSGAIIPMAALPPLAELFCASDPQQTGTSPLKAFQEIMKEALEKEGISPDTNYQIELENEELVSLEEFMKFVDKREEEIYARWHELETALSEAYFKPYS